MIVKRSLICANLLRIEEAVSMAKLSDRLQEAQHLQEIEGNPLTAAELAMFEMFEREK